MIKLLAPPIKRLAESARDLGRRATSGGQWLVALSKNPDVIRPPVMSEAIVFQDPIDEICEEPPPRFMRSMLYIVLGMFALTVLIAGLVKVEIVVVGNGRLATETPPIMLQAMDRSIVREVKVRTGDAVTKGQVLATLDPTFTQADLASLTAKQRAMLSQIRRLEAELNDVDYEVLEPSNPDDLMQANLYRQRQAQYASQQRVYDQEIERRRSSLKLTADDRTALAKQLEIAREIETMRATMLEKQSGSKLNYLEAQSGRMRIEQAYQDTGNRLSELDHDLESKIAERQAFIDQWRNQVTENLVAVRTESTIIGEGMTKASLMNNLVILTAPEDGIVLDVAKKAVGSFINGSEPLITLIKSNTKFIAEIVINSSDIGYTQAGDDVVIKVDAFPWQRHGLMHGRLIAVSEESFPVNAETVQSKGLPGTSRTGGGAVHRGLVEMLDSQLDNIPEGSKLIPGMTLSAEIKVGTRSVLSFFLNPLTKGLSESIREP